ncbi:MAG: EAL domain-containing protein [Aquabacterium sp.]
MGAAIPSGSSLLSAPDEAPDWHALLQRLPAPVLAARQGRIVFLNAALQQLFGLPDPLTDPSQPEAAGTLHDLFAPEDRDVVAVHLKRLPTLSASRPFEVQGLHSDGHRFDARVIGTRMPLGDAMLDVFTVQDISDLRSDLRQSRHNEEAALQALDQASMEALLLAQLPMPVLVVDETARIRHANEAVCRLLGYSQAEMLAMTIYKIAPHRRPDQWHEGLRSLKQAGARSLPSDWCTAHGRTLQVQLHATWFRHDEQDMVIIALQPTPSPQGPALGADTGPRAAQFCDITGLPNQHKLREHLRSEALLAIMDRRDMAVLTFAIQDWQHLSEAEGYVMADTLLRALVRRLMPLAKGTDMLAHLGGGEFALIYSHTSEVTDDTALLLCRGIQEAITAPLQVERKSYALSCSIGVVIFPRDTNEPDHVLRQAQSAMRIAASRGPNRVLGYTPESNARFSARLAREAALRGALERQEFHLCFQPQVDLDDGRIVGVEALLRWQHPQLGEVPPADFLPIAEDTGLILPIGNWVLEQACEAARRWQQAGLPSVRMAVNLSARQLQAPNIVKTVDQALMRTGLSPQHLVLELNEGLLHDEADTLGKTLGQLKALGVSMALDGFGTGHSGLQHLRRLPIDIVKIDRSLVPDVTADVQDVSITRAIINMAHAMQKKVLAVGVENPGELAMLCANQCDQIQGFCFSPPVPESDVVGMLREGRRLLEATRDQQRRQRTLLVVDDDPNIVASLKRLLRPDGYRVLTASCGEEGLRLLAANEIDVILSDQRMPGLTGVEFLQRAKALYPDTLRMVLSGFTELRTVTAAINEGAIYKFLTKPWEDEHLRRHVHEAFHQKEMADENRRLNREITEANQELADVNSRLQHLLSSQKEHLHREETQLVVAREMLENIPVPVIGLDQHGMVAFMNPDAERLLEGAAGMLGRHVDEAAGGALAQAWQEADGVCRHIVLDGRPYRAVCRPLTGDTRSRGAILVLYPPTT